VDTFEICGGYGNGGGLWWC